MPGEILELKVKEGDKVCCYSILPVSFDSCHELLIATSSNIQISFSSRCTGDCFTQTVRK